MWIPLIASGQCQWELSLVFSLTILKEVREVVMPMKNECFFKVSTLLFLISVAQFFVDISTLEMRVMISEIYL